MSRVYVSCDTAARSVGADAVAERLERIARRDGFEVDIVRTGSRGMLWLEPMVEVDTPEGRVGYGNVTVDDLQHMINVGLLEGRPLSNSIGLVDEYPWLAKQQRVTFARVGVVDPLSLADYEAHGGLTGLRVAIASLPSAIVDQVTASGLRGRGGAGFPAGIKWRTVMSAAADQKYVVCNADEGDSGTYADRMLMEGDPFTLVEGMTIAGVAVGATKGYIYIRSEYPAAIATMRKAVQSARNAGVLGPSVLQSGFAFDIEIRVGAGSYVCGEETAMLESLEGKRGVVRAKPPIPALEGLHGKPTVVNNVLTLATVPMIMADGGAAYAALGSGNSKGTQVFQLGGNIQRGGIVETPFGVTMRDLIVEYGGGTFTGLPIKAIQIGGPLGAYHGPDELGTPMTYEDLLAAGGMLGHGGLVVFDETANLATMARFAMEFCAEESCGKCTPCRIGSTRGVEVIDRIIEGTDRSANLVLLNDLCDTMTDGSLCAMGGLTPLPVRSALRLAPRDFGIDKEDGHDGTV